MRIDWALPCRYAEAPGDGTASMIGAGIDSFWREEVPVDLSLYLMMKIAGTEDELSASHQLDVKLIAPDSSEAEMLSLAFSLPEMPPLKTPGLEAGVLIPSVIRWESDEFGLHTLEVLLDGRRQRSLAMMVRPFAELSPPSE